MADVDLTAAVDAIARLATPEDRADAQRVLVGAGGEAIPLLLGALGEAGPSGAQAIIETLGLMGDLRAVSPLRRILRRSDPDLACAAAEALGHIPHGAAVWALRDGLESARQRVRIEALLSLARQAASEETLLATQAEVTLLAITPADVGQFVEALLWRLPPRARDVAFAGALRADPSAAVETALRHLQHRNMAQSARDALRCIEALHPLIFLLTTETAADILPVLADIGNHLQAEARGHGRSDGRADEALDDIVTVLTNWYDPEDTELAALVVEGLRALGDHAIDLLRHRLTRADADERPIIVSLLRALAWEPAANVEDLRYLLAAGEWERVAEMGAGVVEPLLDELQGPDLIRREGAARALARLGWEPEDRVMGYRLAATLGRWDALPRRDAAARTLLLNALAEEREIARVTPPSADERAPRRAGMVRALARFPAAEAVAGLLATLRADPSPKVREEAFRALDERGREAVPLVAQTLAREEGTEPEASSYRRNLIHLLARRGAHARPAVAILRRLAEKDPSRPVRDAARAALERITGRGAQRVGRRGIEPIAVAERPSPGPTLGPRAAADVGQALQSRGSTSPDDLAALIDGDDPAQVGRAVAALVSMGRAGAPVLAPLERALLTSSLAGRRAAAQALDRLAQRPTRPEALAAYHLARGDLAACEAVGAPARRVLREALPLLDWRSAGAVALSLLRLGEPLSSPELASVAALLARVASLPDGRVDESVVADERLASGARGVSLAVSRAADRRAARNLLIVLQEEAQRLALSR